MAYINVDEFKRKLIDEKNFFPAIVARALDEMPTADVVPREEVAELIKEANRKVLKKAAFKFAGHSDYHGDTILSKLICMAEGKEVEAAAPISYESRSDIKREVAREIFEEIDILIVRRMIPEVAFIDDSLITDIAELKKKYIGDKE